jgi:hypothetical protein
VNGVVELPARQHHRRHVSLERKKKKTKIGVRTTV